MKYRGEVHPVAAVFLAQPLMVAKALPLFRKCHGSKDSPYLAAARDQGLQGSICYP